MTKTSLVKIFAKQFGAPRPVVGAEITDIHSGASAITDDQGYALLSRPVGSKLTPVFSKKGMPFVQTATVMVPEEGLLKTHEEITFQVPSQRLYDLLSWMLRKPEPNRHHVATTVLQQGTTYYNERGEAGAKVTLHAMDGSNFKKEADLYMGHGKRGATFSRAILTHVFPFLRHFRRAETTLDGGALFLNVPKGEHILRASKAGVVFSETVLEITSQSPAFLNAAPNQGPRVLSCHDALALTPVHTKPTVG